MNKPSKNDMLKNVGIYSVILVAFFWVASCDENFEPRQENTSYFFSIYGYLDAMLDTQWVRLTPVRDNFDPDTDQIDVNVVIRNIETGEEVAMNDSLFNPNSLVAYWNFWTTMSIEPEQTYEIVATNNEREQSRVVVTIPKDYPTPINAINRDGEVLLIKGVKNVAEVSAIYLVKDTFFNKKYIFSYSHIEDSTRSFEDPSEVPFKLDYERDLNLISREFPETEWLIEKQQLNVVSAGPEWINFYELDDDIYTLPEGVSNVENGVGFLLGTISKTVPYEYCVDDKRDFIACELEDRIN